MNIPDACTLPDAERPLRLAEAARETACCSFFTFTVTPLNAPLNAGQVRLDVEVPAAQVDVVDALQQLATR